MMSNDYDDNYTNSNNDIYGHINTIAHVFP